MRKVYLLLLSIVFLLGSTGIAAALTYTDFDDTPAYIDNNGPEADYNYIFDLGFPGWYDSTLVTTFDLTLYGDNDNSSQNIDFFINYGYGFTNVESWNAPAYTPFQHTISLLGMGSDFDGAGFLQVAYGCHFDHLKTEIFIEQTNPVPEPTTMLLFGTGLIGFAGARRKFKK